MGYYKIVRFTRKKDGTTSRRTLRMAPLTLQEAKIHCQREDTHKIHKDGHGWFDGFERVGV